MQGITYTNPSGTVNATADDDLFIFDRDGTSYLDGLGGYDTLRLNATYPGQYGINVTISDSVQLGSITRPGKFSGIIERPYDFRTSFYNLEDIGVIGTTQSDFFSVTLGSTTKGINVVFDAGAGDDMLSFEFAGLSDGLSFVVDSAGITSSFGSFAGFERFIIAGGAGDDVIRTGSGNDQLRGGGGSNILDGGDGDDVIYSTSLTDFSDGGAGQDVWSGSYGPTMPGFPGGVTTPMTITIGNEIIIDGRVVARNVENINIGSGSGNDQFTVSRLGAVNLSGGAGTDTLTFNAVTNQSELFVVSSRTDGTLTGTAVLTGFTAIEKVQFVGGIGNDRFELSGVFTPDQIDFNGGEGQDLLVARFGLLSGAINFSVANDGTVVTDRGHFSGFEQYSITGGNLADNLGGGAGNDILDGGPGDDKLYGGDGNDTLYAGQGADILDGGNGDDVIAFTSLEIIAPAPSEMGSVIGGAGYDTINLRDVWPSVVGVLETSPGQYGFGLYVGSRAFTITGVERLLTGDNDDAIDLSLAPAGFEARGGGGADSFSGVTAAFVYGEEGDDSFFISGTFGGPATQGGVDGGAGNDLLQTNIAFTVDLAAGTASAGSASFTITSIERVEVAATGGYVATVYGSSVGETFSVNPLFDDGTAVIFDGRGGDDMLVGGKGNDTLNGGLGDDILTGGDGDDRLVAGTGHDVLIGGNGDDSYYVTDARAEIVELASNSGGLIGKDSLYLGVDYTLAPGVAIELVNLTLRPVDHAANDLPVNFIGNEFGQIVEGSDGNNIVDGGGGNDWLRGFGGDDVLKGGSGYDTLDGGSGQDWLILGDDGGNASGGIGNDSVWGGAGNDILEGGPGDDTITGGAGIDTVTYASAASRVTVDLGWIEEQDTRGAGWDTLVGIENVIGSAYDDRLAGDRFANVLEGGAGADTYVFKAELGGGNIDLIIGFAPGSDTIELSSAIFSAIAPGVLSDGAFVVGTAAGDADDRIIYNSTTGALYYDADGSGAGAAVQFATLGNAPMLSAASFVVG